MSLFQNLFGSSAPKPPLEPVVSVPTHLPKIKAPTAAQVCEQYKPEPPAQQLLTPQQTPAQYLNLLEKKQLSEESVKLLAYGLPERESVWWATQCAQKVSSPLNLPDEAAIKAADAWVKNPSELTKKAAADAAAKTDFQTPGAWAAQAAAWSKPTPTVVPAQDYGRPQNPTGWAMPAAPVADGPADPLEPRLAPHAVVGAVMLAIAVKLNKIPAVPKSEVPKLEAPNAKAEASKLAASGLEKAGVPSASPMGAGSGLSKLAAAGGGGIPATGAAASLAASLAAPLAAPFAAPLAAPLVVANPGMPGVGALAQAAGLANPAGASSLAASSLSPQSAEASALAAAKAQAAKLNPTQLSPADVSKPESKAQDLAKKEISKQERAELNQTATPFIKLGIDIASGTVSLA